MASNILKIIALIIFLIYVFVQIYFSKSIFSGISNFFRLSRLNKSRGTKTLIDFKEHFINKKNIEEDILDLVIYTVRRVIHIDDFAPKLTDSFTKDYKWNTIYWDQYSSKRMMLAGYILEELNMISITEKDWEDFENTYGQIDNYESLFDYLNTKHPIYAT